MQFNPAQFMALLVILPEMLDLIGQALQTLQELKDPKLTQDQKLDSVTAFVLNGYKALDKQYQLPDSIDFLVAALVPHLVRLVASLDQQEDAHDAPSI